MTGDDLISLTRTYATHIGLSLPTVSTYMGGSGDTIDRLTRGHDITTRRLSRFVQWFSDHWPEDLEWPDDIPRPDRSAQAEEATQ